MLPRQPGEPAPPWKPRGRARQVDRAGAWKWPTVDEVDELFAADTAAAVRQIVTGHASTYGLGAWYRPPDELRLTAVHRWRSNVRTGSAPVTRRPAIVSTPIDYVGAARLAARCRQSLTRPAARGELASPMAELAPVEAPPYAVATLQIAHKALTIGDGGRTFAGMATTPHVDRQGHSVDPFGVTFRNPLPLLWQHDHGTPVGTVRFLPATAEGIAFEASMPVLDAPGPLKDRVDLAWQCIKAGLVTSVSIGFRVLADGVERLASGAMNLRKTEVVELSLVTIPSNPGAEIRFVKSLAGVPAIMPPGDSGTIARDRARPTPMTIPDQIAAAEQNRATKTAAMLSLMQTAADTGTTLDADQTKAYDTLSDEVAALDGTVKRWRELETLNVAAARPVAAFNRPVPVISVKSNQAKGTTFVRACMSLARAHGDKMLAVQYAKEWADTPEVELYLKAATAPGTTTDPAWAGPLAVMTNATNEFLELLRPATILGKIPGLRQVPFNTTVPVQSAGGLYQWVGQGKGKPVGKLAFSSANLGIAKAAGIIVLTEELVRVSSPSAEAIVRNDMVKGIAQFLDQQFIDPAVAAVANVSPASITNGAATFASSGSAYRDISTLIGMLAAANIPLGGVVLIMSESNGFTLGMLRDGSGNRLFPNVSATGGTIDGVSVVTSNAAQQLVIAAQPNLILYADDGGVSIDVSREASVQMDTAPMSPPDATVVLTSLWQENLVGLRAERFINWNRAVPASVAYATGAAYITPAAEGASGQATGNGGTTRGTK